VIEVLLGHHAGGLVGEESRVVKPNVERRLAPDQRQRAGLQASAVLGHLRPEGRPDLGGVVYIEPSPNVTEEGGLLDDVNHRGEVHRVVRHGIVVGPVGAAPGRRILGAAEEDVHLIHWHGRVPQRRQQAHTRPLIPFHRVDGDVKRPA